MAFITPKTEKEMKQNLKKAILDGVLFSAGAYFLLGQRGNMKLGGVSLPAVVGLSVTSAAASLAVDVVHPYVMTHTDDKYKFIMEAGAVGVANVASLYLIAGALGKADMLTILKTASLGSGAYVASHYVSDYFKLL